MDLHQYFLDISGVELGNVRNPFQTDFSGYLGIAPWTADPDNKERNFLWQLRNQGMVDHMTISFFVHLDDNKYPNSGSTIKFGSWDPINVADDDEIKFVRTVDKTTWDMKVNYLKLDSNSDNDLRFEGRVRMDPGLPYLYVPQDVYDQFTGYMNTKYGAKTCLPSLNICKF